MSFSFALAAELEKKLTALFLHSAEDLRITVGDIIDVGGRGALIEACKKAERAAERQA